MRYLLIPLRTHLEVCLFERWRSRGKWNEECREFAAKVTGGTKATPERALVAISRGRLSFKPMCRVG